MIKGRGSGNERLKLNSLNKLRIPCILSICLHQLSIQKFHEIFGYSEGMSVCLDVNLTA